MNQSSNDSFPTAMHIAAVQGIAVNLIPHERTHRELRKKKRRSQKSSQIGRNPHPGCDTADLGTGILRLCRAGRERHRAAAASR